MNIWEDEAYTLNTTSGNLSEVISESYGFEGQPPAYFILLSFWRLIHPGIFTARLFSVLCIGLTVYVLIRILSRITDLKYPNWIIVIFLLNPFTVWAALEIRTYALLIFLASVAVYSALIYAEEKRKAYLYLFLLISLLGLYTQYYFAFLIAAIAIGILIQHGWNVFFRVSLHLIPVVILFLPNFYFLTDNIKNFQSDNPGYSMVERISVVLTSAQSITLGLNIIPKMTVIRWLVRIAFVLIIIFSLLKVYKKKNNKIFSLQYNFLLVVTVVTFAFFMVFTFITGMKFNIRYLAISFPLIILLFTIFYWNSEGARNMIFSVFSIYFVVLLTIKYTVPVKSYDYESIAKFVEQTEKSGEPLLFNSRTISTPFHYYYKGKNEVVQLPDSFKLTKEGFQVLLRDTTDVKQMFESIDSESFILINDNMRGYSSKLLLNSEILDNYLNTRFYVALDTLLFGRSKNLTLRIRRLESQLPEIQLKDLH